MIKKSKRKVSLGELATAIELLQCLNITSVDVETIENLMKLLKKEREKKIQIYIS